MYISDKIHGWSKSDVLEREGISADLIETFEKKLSKKDACSAYHLVGYVEPNMIEKHPGYRFLVVLELILRCIYMRIHVLPFQDRDAPHSQRLVYLADALISANVVPGDCDLASILQENHRCLATMVRDEVKRARDILAREQQSVFCTFLMLYYTRRQATCGKRGREDDEGGSRYALPQPLSKEARGAKSEDEPEEGEIRSDQAEESRDTPLPHVRGAGSEDEPEEGEIRSDQTEESYA